MCKGVDQTTGQPISRTNSFNDTDEAAFCWFYIDVKDISGMINVTGMWYDPSNALYSKHTASFQGGSTWYRWEYILIKGYSAAEKLGWWRVDIYLTGGPFQNTRLFTETFTIWRPTYDQPLEGFAWPTREIPVIVESSPDYARNAVLSAMQNWNLAQTWFADTYRLSSRPYRLVEVTQVGESYIRVYFNQTQTRDDWGYTWYNYWWDSSGVFYKITVSISLDLTLSSGRSLSAQELKALAAHELGHALGLGHTTFSETDLMNHYSPGQGVTVPSTLNLYALALLSLVTSRNNMPTTPVTLTTSIPYLTPPESAIPEMSSPAIALTLAMVIVILITSREIYSARKKQSTCNIEFIKKRGVCGG
jgi:hypothetical protein